ncbi:hypothetical protein QL285_003170 [Trifolium repens]|nr:hypothetical protein QL285_003170 [Trifolium repens]
MRLLPVDREGGRKGSPDLILSDSPPKAYSEKRLGRSRWNELGNNDQSLVKLAWLTLPSLEDKDPLPDSRGSAIDSLFGLEVASTAELLRLGVPGRKMHYIVQVASFFQTALLRMESLLSRAGSYTLGGLIILFFLFRE